MVRRHFFFFFLTYFLSGQVETDKPLFPCGHSLSAARWLEAESSLTENQEKIDVTYYRIDFEIDIGEEEIDGSVLANGWISLIL